MPDRSGEVSKHTFSLGYVQLLIVKHALQYYLERPGNSQDKDSERHVLRKIEEEIAFVKEKLGF